LGHIVSEDGIAMDPKKIEAIKGWPTLTNILEVRSFMSLSSYYKIYIAKFSKISHPIKYLQKKGVKFEWSFKCEENFQCLKDLLTGAPILKVVNLDEDFILSTDACKETLGGVLMQNGHVICYESIKLKEHEIYYYMDELELEASYRP